MYVFGSATLLSGAKLNPRIKGILLLGGSVRRGSFATATGRTVLDLPLKNGWSLLQHWQHQAAEIARCFGLGTLPLRLLLDRRAPLPVLPAPLPEVQLRVERDPRPVRGTGGILRDATLHYHADDFIVVGNAAQILLQPLTETVAAMAATGGDLCVVSHPDGTPSGLMLIKCACLRLIPEIGFFDMKEQALPLISERHKGSVVYRKIPCGLPVKNLEDYIRALSWYHRHVSGRPVIDDPFEEDWKSTFSIVEDGAMVDPGVRLHDSIVLRGGRVESDAFVVRSIVCPRGVVGRKRTVVNSLVCTES